MSEIGLNQRAIWSAIAVIAVVMIAIFALHNRRRNLPCPARAEDAGREILLENANVVIGKRDDMTVDAYAKNNSPRAIVSLMVEATLADGRVLRTEANNNEPSAPSLADAPILPGAWRAIRLYFRSGPSDNSSPNLRVVGCSCD
jgi:hypothetical protein